MIESSLPQAPIRIPATVDLSSSDVRVLRDRLVEEQRFLLTQLASLRAERDADPRASHDEVSITLLSGAGAALDDIKAALLRMEQGEYGVCTGCHEAIAPARLDALPMAGLCMPCQHRRSKRAR